MDFEQFLDDLYKTELVFQIDKEEVDFIQTGIETLVQIIADLMWTNAFRAIENETEHVMRKYPELRISRNGKYAMSDVIKAGSFYELTKNGYPDQFDFIFLMCVFESRNFVENENSLVGDVSDLHVTFRDILSSSDFAFPTLDERKRYIRFDRYLVRKGPASKLRFIYGCNEKEKYIYVDLVPAFKVLILNQEDQDVGKCEITGFREEIKKTGSIILVQEHVSYVETELYFMKNILSAKHIKAYRILKYILKGNYNNEQVRNKSKSEFWGVFTKCTPRLVPSYHMKRAVISHHYECIDCRCEEVASCLLDMLEKLKDISCIVSVKKLYELFLERPFVVTGYRTELLDNTITAFKEMKTKSFESRSSNTQSFLDNPALTCERKKEINQSKVSESFQKNDPNVLLLEMQLLDSSWGKVDRKDETKRSTETNRFQVDPNGSNILSNQQPLVHTFRDNGDRKDKTMPKCFNKPDLNILPLEQPLINSFKESDHRTEHAKHPAKLNKFQKPGAQEIPLIDTAEEKDDRNEPTKASDWVKTLSTYLTNLVLIAMCGFFAIFVLYALSHRS